MEQLPGTDAVFLAVETPDSPAHVGGLVVLDADLLSAPDEELLSMGDRVMLTMVGGHVEYWKEGAELAQVGR